MAEPRPPSPAEAREWIGFALDEMDGGAVGRVHSLYVDSAAGEPTWLVVAVERRGLLPWGRAPILVAVPARDCAGAAGRVWTAHGRRELLGAPVVDPERPLMREHELQICAHYGIGSEEGRGAELAGRDEGAVTSQPG